MKGIIVEKLDDKCVLLLSDGTFRTVKAAGEPQIGTVFYINTQHSAAFYLQKAASMVAAILLVVFLGWGAYSWTIPVQYINIDINPSVELAINRYDRIIRMTPLNDDGERLLKSVDLQMQKVDRGVHAVIETAKGLGYLADERDVLISVSSADSELRQKTQEEIKNKVAQKAEVLVFDSSEHDQSVQEGLSPGKKKIIGKVMESGTNLTEEELADVPVKDLMLRINENKKMKLELEKEAKQQEKQRKEAEKAARKEIGKTSGEQGGNRDDQGIGGNKPGNTEKQDVKPKGKDNSGKEKQADRDSVKKGDKVKGKKEDDKDKSNGNVGVNGTEDNGNPTGENEISDIGNPGKSPDKTGNEGTKSKPSANTGKQNEKEQPGKEKDKEKNNGNQSADKKGDEKNQTMQKGDANHEKPSDNGAKNKEKDDKNSDNGNSNHKKDNNGADAKKKDEGGH